MNARAVSLLVALAAGFTPAAYASVPRATDDGCSARPQPVSAAHDDARWPAPLDRMVTLRSDDASLGATLERIGTEARVRLSYSASLLPLQRSACVGSGRAMLGDALTLLLNGTGITPVVAGSDQVVLTPSRAAAVADATPAVAITATRRLERVVVTGTASGAPERASPFAVEVADRRTLPEEGALSLAQAFDGNIPGVWVWTQAPTSALTRYGSMRGANSFGVTTPKIYVDGIEVANPLLFQQIDPSQVERIEVIRGPQGAALYGSDAISGVVNVVTRHDGVSALAPRAEVQGSAGATSSSFVNGGVLTQRHEAVLRTGTGARTAALNASFSRMGAYVPGADAQRVLLGATGRRVGASTILTGIARFDAFDSHIGTNPLLVGLNLGPLTQPLGANTPQSTRQYTVGGTLTAHSSDRWTHVITAGVDGYRMAGMSADDLLVPSAADSALRAARGSADRLTLKASSTQRFGAPESNGLSLTYAVDHSAARETSNGWGNLIVPDDWRARADSNMRHGGDDHMPPAATLAESGSGTTSWSNTGVLAQGQLALRNTLFISGGERYERIGGTATGAQDAWLPMVGGAVVRDAGAFTFKLRGAYGRGIRPARTVARGATWSGGREDQLARALSPEQQSGTEAGVDLLFDSALLGRMGIHVTRFDQLASNLVQPVAVITDTATSGRGGPSGPGGRRIGYELENVGAITNRGWEFQGGTRTGPLALTATLSLVDSRVNQLAPGYRGDLQLGERMLEVPARTAGLSASWLARRWSMSLSASRAFDWINYDRLALADSVSKSVTSSGATAAIPVGVQLRQFWRRYDGATQLGTRGSVTVLRGAALTFSVDNLLNHQRGEPDNITIVPGRTVAFGLRFGF
ncbi:MAG: TonB-dependent receptor plug [Gemmatimonadetes bacterium]|nr:TonB-dependent receptor plug [Gemmatimonadota bacterium]